jgi:hypothetical protein
MLHRNTCIFVPELRARNANILKVEDGEGFKSEQYLLLDLVTKLTAE